MLLAIGCSEQKSVRVNAIQHGKGGHIKNGNIPMVGRLDVDIMTVGRHVEKMRE